MKKDKVILNFIFLYFVSIFFYGIIIKFTIFSNFIFQIKTYFPEILLLIVTCLTLYSWSSRRERAINKYELLGSIYFFMFFLVNIVIHGTSIQLLYLIRDMFLPMIVCLVLMKKKFEQKALEKFYNKLTVLCTIYLICGAFIGIVQSIGGWEWTSQFYTGYSFYGLDDYSKVKVTETMGMVRTPGLTGNFVTFSYYGIFAILVIFNSQHIKPIIKYTFIIPVIIILVCTLNKTAIIVFSIIILHNLIKKFTLPSKLLLSTIALLGGLVFVVSMDNISEFLSSTIERLEYWSSLSKIISGIELLFPYNMFLYSSGGTGITSFWDNTYLYVLFSFGVVGCIFIFGLIFKMYRTNSRTTSLNRLLFKYVLIFFLLAALFNNLTSGRSLFSLLLIINSIYYRENMNNLGENLVDSEI